MDEQKGKSLQDTDPRQIGPNRTTKEEDEKERIHEDLATRKDVRKTGNPSKPQEKNFI